MKVANKQLWSVYAIVWITSAIVLGFVTWNEWDSQKNKQLSQQYAAVELFSSGVKSMLLSHETLLTILGEQLYTAQMERQSSQTSNAPSHPSLERLLSQTPSFAYLSYQDSEGQITFLAKSFEGSPTANPIDDSQSKRSFEQAMNATSMILGKTYYSNAANATIIPISMAITNDSKEFVGVMNAGVQVNESNLFSKEINLSNSHDIGIVRTDRYWQFVTNTTYKNSESNTQQLAKQYQKPLEKKYFQYLLNSILAEQGIELVELMTSENIYSFEIINDEESLQVAVSYDPKFKHWYFSNTEFHHIEAVFFEKFAAYLVTFLAIHFILYILFLAIAKNDSRTKNILIYQATHDSLTKLPNRKFLRDQFTTWIKRKPTFSLLFIDLDHFKNVNDSHGHEHGDLVLIEVATRINALMDSEDILIREAGDEFIVVSSHVDTNYLTHLGNSIVDLLSAPFTLPKGNVVLGCSVGIALFPLHGKSLKLLLRAADAAMYEAKKQKNSFCFYADKLESAHMLDIQIEQKLHTAIAEGKISVVYQPQTDATSDLYGFEALLRWQDDELGSVSPSKFIPIAENSGQITSLSRYVFKQVMQDMQVIRKKFPTYRHVAVNISVIHFMNPTFIEDISPILTFAHDNNLVITLEMTESILIKDISYAQHVLKKLKLKGARISLDDFGTGYSSLSMLKDLPLDEIKIDKSFIRSLLLDKKSIVMVQNIIDISKNLQFSIVAEGIESHQQLTTLIDKGCDVFQGNHISPAIPLEEIYLLQDSIQQTKPFAQTI